MMQGIIVRACLFVTSLGSRRLCSVPVAVCPGVRGHDIGHGVIEAASVVKRAPDARHIERKLLRLGRGQLGPRPVDASLGRVLKMEERRQLGRERGESLRKSGTGWLDKETYLDVNEAIWRLVRHRPPPSDFEQEAQQPRRRLVVLCADFP